MGPMNTNFRNYGEIRVPIAKSSLVVRMDPFFNLPLVYIKRTERADLSTRISNR